ncbi:MAG: hypothetical protein JKY13_02135 [Gammaproteobacteria bacterium]|nr:hypothetical protein [Gammaproteobacteria bacterium]
MANFSLRGDYVSATSNFDELDLSTGSKDSHGAQPWAVNVAGGYKFKAFGGHTNKIILSYQQSGDAVNVWSGVDFGGFYLPKRRYEVGYNFTVNKYVTVKAVYDHNVDYDKDQGGTGIKDDVGQLQLGVTF